MDPISTAVAIAQALGRRHRSGAHLPGDWSQALPFNWLFLLVAEIRCSSWLILIVNCRCDRVLWYGQGLQQLDYSRNDSKLSDHRAVTAMFTAEVEVVSRKKLKKACVHFVNDDFDVSGAVVPMVKPIIDVHKVHTNELWSALM